MITIIFLDEQNQVVSVSFRRNPALSNGVMGTWNINTNQVELNDEAWHFFQVNRNNIRKLKPLMERLIKLPLKIGAPPTSSNP